MITITFTVPGNPLPKERARVVTTKTGKRRAFTPSRTKGWEDTVAWAYREAGGDVLDGRVSVSMWFYRADRRACDLDNLIKAVLDGLNKVAWDDDAQVECICAWRDYDAEEPRIEIEIEVME